MVRVGFKLTEEEEQLVLELYKEGMESKLIQEKFEISHQTVRSIVKRLGGTLRPRGHPRGKKAR